MIPADAVRLVQTDPWVRKLMIGSLAAVTASFVLFVIFKLFLMYGASAISNLAAH
jgi:hypothetical protein